MRRRGSYAVEFAVVSPLLLILASGVIDLGHYLVSADALVAAVSDGARAGALEDPDDGGDPVLMAEYVADRNYTAAELSSTATFAAASAGAAPGTAITLTGTSSVDPYFGFAGLPTEVIFSTTMRLAHQ